jgi:DNA-binding transcriptional MerR regulator
VNESEVGHDQHSSERGYLSIGEVLLLLQDEFPDVTISKIRFLESQGLIEPERTPSGYRKFFDTDVERLRYILREQKDHYLPLRVIKHRLETEPTGPLNRLLDPTDPEGIEATEVDDPTPTGPLHGQSNGIAPSVTEDVRAGELLGADELRRQTGLTADELRELERYGIVSSRLVSGEFVYAREELDVARATVAFLRRGVEARHLRMYRQAVEREVSLVEQIVLPYLKQRNPQARRQAEATLDELAVAGGELRSALVRTRLRGLLDG